MPSNECRVWTEHQTTTIIVKEFTRKHFEAILRMSGYVHRNNSPRQPYYFYQKDKNWALKIGYLHYWNYFFTLARSNQHFRTPNQVNMCRREISWDVVTGHTFQNGTKYGTPSYPDTINYKVVKCLVSVKQKNTILLEENDKIKLKPPN